MHLVLDMFIFIRALGTCARTAFKPRCCLHFQMVCTQTKLTVLFFFFGWCYSYGPQQGPDRNQKKEERGLKQRRKQKEAAQGDPEPKKGNQEKEKKSK